jgi:hypothetical protein
MLDHWSAFQHETEHEGQLRCGLGAVAALFVGTIFSTIASSVAAFISHSARRKYPENKISKLETTALALGPLWFILCSIGLSMSISLLRHR